MSSPWRELLSCAVASAIGDAVVIDVTNPLTEDFMGTTMTRPVINGVAQVVPVAGDDPEAKVLVLVVV